MWTRGLLLAVAASTLCVAADTAPSADAILDAAKAQAQDSRAVWVIFHASWCGWCKKLDSFIEAQKPTFDKYFVVAHIRVDEHQGSKFTDDPGAKALETSLGGANAGLPFFAFVKGDGMIVNSMAPLKGNIGHPSQPHEVDWFMEMLQKAAPGMTAGERASIERPLRAQKT